MDLRKTEYGFVESHSLFNHSDLHSESVHDTRTRLGQGQGQGQDGILKYMRSVYYLPEYRSQDYFKSTQEYLRSSAEKVTFIDNSLAKLTKIENEMLDFDNLCEDCRGDNGNPNGGPPPDNLKHFVDKMKSVLLSCECEEEVDRYTLENFVKEDCARITALLQNLDFETSMVKLASVSVNQRQEDEDESLSSNVCGGGGSKEGNEQFHMTKLLGDNFSHAWKYKLRDSSGDRENDEILDFGLGLNLKSRKISPQVVARMSILDVGEQEQEQEGNKFHENPTRK